MSFTVRLQPVVRAGRVARVRAVAVRVVAVGLVGLIAVVGDRQLPAVVVAVARRAIGVRRGRQPAGEVEGIGRRRRQQRGRQVFVADDRRVPPGGVDNGSKWKRWSVENGSAGWVNRSPWAVSRWLRDFRVLPALTRIAALPAAFGVLQAIAFAGGLEDLTAMRQPIESCSGQSLAAKHLGPILER
jgi:hypothetical protein